MSAMLLMLVFVSLVNVTTGSFVRLQDNGYSGLVLAIDDRVSVDRCVSLISNIKDLLNSASSFLYSATNQRTYFRDVTILVPKSWPRSCTGSQSADYATVENFLSADFRVGRSHPLHGDAAWTFQWGLCGRPGKYIHIPEKFILPTLRHVRLDQARSIVHEWAKYRWGVFDERGYPSDPLYPTFHRSSLLQWTPTVCSNRPVAGVVSPTGCKPGDGDCTFVPFQNGSNSAVISSLMSIKQLPQIRKFCDSTNHVNDSPTKQNLLCAGRSVWDVMQHHNDFFNGNNPPSPNASVSPVQFRFVKASADRLFLMLESTDTMRRQERWDYLVNSVRKLISWDVPTGTLLGIGHFGRRFRADRNVTAVPELLQGRVELANLPPIADAVVEEQKSWTAAVDGALQALGSHAPGATLVMVTGNQRNSGRKPSRIDIDYMIAALKQRRTRLVVIFYPNETPGLSEVALSTGGESIVVPDAWLGSQTSISVFRALADTYLHVLMKYSTMRSQLRTLLEDREFRGDGHRARGSFMIDPSLGGNTTFSVLYHGRNDIGYVKLRPPGGRMTQVYMHPDSTNHLQYTRVQPTPGRWEYEIDNLAASHNSIFVQVVSSPTSSTRDTIRVQMWTNALDSGTLNATDSPLILYTSVMHGDSPVVDAEVYAVVSRQDGSRVRVRLVDNGLGVPDLTYGDGVYSRYFTSFGSSSSGSERLHLRVEIGGVRARMLINTRSRSARSALAPISPCCGSTIGPHVQSVQISDLRRKASAGDLAVVGIPPPGRDIYPPSRITDLRAEINSTLRTVTFRWTAAGDDFDMPDTKVSRYEVRFSDDRNVLMKNFSKATSVPHWTQPRPAGEPSVAVIDFNMFNTLLYFAIRGVDEAGNKAPVSNIVTVVVPPPPISTSTTPPIINPQPSGSVLDRSTLLIILLCVAAALMFIVCIAVYFFMCYRRRTKNEKTIKADSITVIPYDRSRASTPVKHPALTMAYNNTLPKQESNGVATISDGRTPIMWSASEILDTRDMQYGGYGYHMEDSGEPSHHITTNGVDRQNSYQTPYADDITTTAVDDGRSIDSVHAAESVVSMNARVGFYQHPPVGCSHQPHQGPPLPLKQGSERTVAQAAGNSYCWHSDKDALVHGVRQTRPPLPASMRPKVRITPPMDSTMSSTGSDKRRRNVTQV